MFFRGFLIVVPLLIPSLVAMGEVSPPLVQRGGEQGGQETVSVQLGKGVVGVWDIRNGTLVKALIASSDGHESLALGVSSPSWFIGRDDNDKIGVGYAWRGYRVEQGQVVLLHELRLPTGEIRSLQERPESTVGVNGLLAIRSTFLSVGSDGTSTRIIKRIRTGTPGGITIPISTSGDLVPQGLNDNFMADVVFRETGSTVITISFNGNWVDQHKNVSEKESGS